MARTVAFLISVLAGLAVLACGGSEQPSAQATAVRALEPAVAPGVEALEPRQKVGGLVGNRIPDFVMMLADGTQMRSESLLTSAEPAYIFFFATWCVTCRAELRRMKEIWPDYADKVAFYAVGTDPSERIDKLEEYSVRQGYPWPVAQAGEGMLAAFRVVQQSTKIAFDSNGTIVYRDGYGYGDDETWRRVFEELTDGG